jgi:hypothetical protein
MPEMIMASFGPHVIMLKHISGAANSEDPRRCYDFKNIFAKKIGIKLAFFVLTAASFLKL